MIGIVHRLLMFLSARYISLKTASSFGNSDRFFVVDRLLQNRRMLLVDNTNGQRDLRWSPDGSRILFVRVTEGGPSSGFSYDLYTVNVNSLALTRLTTDSVFKFEPGWSPDSSLVTFVISEEAGDNVYVVSSSGAGLRKLTPDGYWYYGIDWPASGSKLAVARESTTGNGSNIVLLDAVTGAEQLLTGDDIYNWRPRWSEDGTRVTFGSNRSDRHNIHVMNIDGSGAAQLAFMCFGSFDPKWSPDGSKIVFTGSTELNLDIFVMNADGSGAARLTDNPASDYLADWSPDGTRIVFVSERDGNAELYVMNADGSGQTRLTNTPENEQEPAWSPDGTKIAFNSNREGTDAIYLMNVDGTGSTRVTPLDVGSFYAAWSRDRSRIAFSSMRSGGWQLWSISPDGTGLTRLTNNSFGSDFQPDW